ncbi:hypothetical protein GCM10023184_19260 [Flaviaesturariibacter amylovorans]|uniref:DUF4382 domain-containing protein n=2 Tax=Flaviaesturariibacter amylovorans TaxID=1084520 RepID=A0ABP8GRW1_9BACT
MLALAAASTLLFACSKKKDDPDAGKATINYQVTSSNASSTDFTFTSAKGSGKQIAFKGDGSTRVEEYLLNFNNVDFFSNGAAGAIASIKVPAGSYTNAQFNYQMIPSRNPALEIRGTYNANGTPVPVRINLDQFVEISTKMPSVTLEAGKTYTATLNLDLAKVVEGITASHMTNATRTNGEVVIAYYSNPALLQTVVNNINNVIQHSVTIQ